MRKLTFTKLWLLLVPIMFFSCKDRFEKHYEVPNWLNGNAWEVLQNEKNYTIFLEGVELAGFRPIMEGKNILTVMAPDDASFEEYLKKNNYSSIRDMDQEDLEVLIGFHLLYYSFKKDRLINFRPEGDLATDEDKASYAGLYYKHRTRSVDPVSLIYSDTAQRRLPVHHQDRMIPVFSHLFFKTLDIDPEYNYGYFYPNSTWTAANDGFNVSNASVDEYEIPAENGYIYKIDAVLKPLNTIYTELNQLRDYSDFINTYEKFQTFSYDESYSQNYGAAVGYDSLYLQRYARVPDIALEWWTTSYKNIAANASYGYTVFAPKNDVMESFFESYWGKYSGYDSLSHVDRVPLSYLLQQNVIYDVVFPEQLSKGLVSDVYGNVLDFDPSTTPADARVICANGVLYGVDKLNMPPYFTSVMGPAFRYKDRLAFMYLLDYSGLMNTYGSPDMNYIMFIPDTQTIESDGYVMRKWATASGYYLQYYKDELWHTVSASLAQDFIRMNTVQTNEPLATTGTQVLATQSSFNYLYVKNGRITTSAAYINYLNPEYTGDPFLSITEVDNYGESWDNGQAFLYSANDGMFKTVGGTLVNTLGSANDYRYEYYLFVELLKKAGLIASNQLNFLKGSTRFLAFIPTAQAILSALADDRIPGITGGYVDEDNYLVCEDLKAEILADYLKQYFILSSDNTINEFPYIGSTFRSGTYLSANDVDEVVYMDNGSSLSIQNVSVIRDYDYFPFVYTDGCLHFIESMF